eukprot:4253089-Pyramimonas_sp.AAC.1
MVTGACWRSTGGGKGVERGYFGQVKTPKGPRHRLQTANQGLQYIKGVHGLPHCTGYKQQ